MLWRKYRWLRMKTIAPNSLNSESGRNKKLLMKCGLTEINKLGGRACSLLKVFRFERPIQVRTSVRRFANANQSCVGELARFPLWARHH